MTKKKIIRSFVSFIVIVLLIIFSLHFYIKKNSSEIFITYLTRFLNKNGAFYKVEHNYIDIDLVGGQILLKNVKISFDEDQLRRSGIRCKFFFKATIPLLSITGISYLDFIMFRKIKADRIYLKKGKLKLYTLSDSNNKNNVPEKTVDAASVSLEELNIEDTDIDFFTQLESRPKSGLRRISLDTGKIQYTTGKTPGNNFKERLPEIKFKADSSFFEFKKTGYRADTGRINFSSFGPSASIREFRYGPSTSKSINKLMSERGSYHQISTSEISLKNIDEKELIKNNRFHVQQLYFQKPEINIFRDRNIKRKISSSGKKLPQQIFRESGIKVEVDLIKMDMGKISYSEIAPREKRAELIYFTSVNLSLKNLSNFPEVLETGRESFISLYADLMGKSKLNAKIVIPVNNRMDAFSFSGTLERTDPRILKSYLKRNVRIRIDRGTLDHMGFAVKADRNTASGIMNLGYRNFRVTLLRKKDLSRKSRFSSFLANTLTYKNNPTKKGGKLREGKIYFKREIKSSIFNYMWNCILSGIKSSIKI